VRNDLRFTAPDSVVSVAKKKTDSRNRWINKLVERRGFNVACVAVANENARIMWALLSKAEDYRVGFADFLFLNPDFLCIS